MKISTNIYRYSPKGDLAWEYNPLRNYRTNKKYFQDVDTKKLYDFDLFLEDNNIPKTQQNSGYWYNSITGIFYNGTHPTSLYCNESNITFDVIQAGEVIDFVTDELNFDIEHPLDILPTYSYDNSTDLIINDGKNDPKLINSRFSVTEKNLYQVVDRKGDNDTNLYTRGDTFELDTSLYKATKTIPRLEYLGTVYGGNLPIGNYHFYFKYLDADGNETDFVAESGLVSVFIGNTPNSIISGYRKENSHKSVKFEIYNTDTAYLYLTVYYTVSSGDIDLNATMNAYKLEDNFLLNHGFANITITGFEKVTEVPVESINLLYQIYNEVESQAICLNRLFFANVSNNTKNYIDLADLSLRITPQAVVTDYEPGLNHKYETKSKNTYYNSKFIYNNTGYWDDEIYRFGVVYIFYNGTLSPVFNIRGVYELSSTTLLEYVEVYNKNNNNEEDKSLGRKYINVNNEYTVLLEGISLSIQNSKGVVKFSCNAKQNQIVGLRLNVPETVIEELKQLKVKGLFFVRLRRIPTTLCQAFTIGIDRESYTPLIPVNNKYIAESFITLNYKKNVEPHIISNNFVERMMELSGSTKVRYDGALCPEYDINSTYLNSLFTGSEFTVKLLNTASLKSVEQRHYADSFETIGDNNNTLFSVKILGIEDNVKRAAINDYMFSTRAGEAEEAIRFEYSGEKPQSLEPLKNKPEVSNLVRGIFGPILGITGLEQDLQSSYFDIKIPGYNTSQLQEYFTIRYNDKSEYGAISDRISFDYNTLWKDGTTQNIDNVQYYQQDFYRGDCYICQFTHRVNRNFQSASAPTNDIIVDPNSWKNNWKTEGGVVNEEELLKANLGDINAVKLGMWVTMIVKSRFNLNIRAIDDSHPTEIGLMGHPRGFYPYHPLSTDGAFKIPEALCYNKGFEKSLSQRWNFDAPDVPAIKTDYSNRICYSDIQIRDAFKNSFRVFQGLNYRDYPKTYGAITKILDLSGNLLCIFEHGIALIPVNERTVNGEGSGGPVFINTNNVLPENPKILSHTFGSLWKDSIIQTSVAVYGVDTVAKKIWRTNGLQLEVISDRKILKFLIDHITLGEKELTPIIGVRNVKTHYNKYKEDVMFTFYNNLDINEECAWNVCWNETTKQWTTFYSWIPSYSENISNMYFSFDRQTSKLISKIATNKHKNTFAREITVDNPIIKFDKSGEFKTTLYYEENDNVKFKLIDPISKKYRDSINGFKISGNELICKLNKFVGEQVTLFIEASNDKGINRIRKITLITEEKYKSLTTSFWKHGQAGIIDNCGDIKPTNWYGKQHPFELEFVVASNISTQKIFDNLEIISNKAEPESFHYEIIGESYEFANDKKNMYIRQEATKKMYLRNNIDITYNPDYELLQEEHRHIEGTPYYDKSTIFPLYYKRLDTLNEIEDSYHLYTESGKDFKNLAGAEIKYVKDLNEFRIVNHCKAVNIKNHGRLRGNMYYNEDKWQVQINPLNLVQKNEPDWSLESMTNVSDSNKIPIELSSITLTDVNSIDITAPDDRGVVSWNNVQSRNSEVKLRDKFIKIRIRYSGEELAVIQSIITLYTISHNGI